MSVDFDPVRLRPRRRRIDPLVIGVVIVAIGLDRGRRQALGVVRIGRRRGRTPPRRDRSPLPPRRRVRIGRHQAAPDSAGPPVADLVGHGVRPYATARDAWGVDAIVDGHAGGVGCVRAGDTYLEQWSRAGPDRRGHLRESRSHGTG